MRILLIPFVQSTLHSFAYVPGRETAKISAWYVPSGVFLAVRCIFYEMLLSAQNILGCVCVLRLNAKLVVC